MIRRLVAFAALVLLSCRTKSVEHPTAVAGRSYKIVSPKHVEPGRKLPVLVVLHAFDTSPWTQAGYFDLDRTFLARSFFVLLPEGKIDKDGKYFWNATDVCCDQHGAGPDDVAYLDAVLDDALGRYPIDPKRVFVTGVSNGAFMAQRYACDRAERIRGFASISGGMWSDSAKCQPSKPLGALLIHGDKDDIVRYDGGGSLIGTTSRYPSASVAAEFWAKRAGATASSTTRLGSGMDIQAWTGGDDVQLWTIRGGGHSIPRSAGLPKRIAEFFEGLK